MELDPINIVALCLMVPFLASMVVDVINIYRMTCKDTEKRADTLSEYKIKQDYRLRSRFIMDTVKDIFLNVVIIGIIIYIVWGIN